MKFTKEEYADLHLLYGKAHGNSRAARLLRVYGERFPEGVLPSRCIFMELHLRLCETGSNTIASPIPRSNLFGFLFLGLHEKFAIRS
jgi:hypothetical protein